MRSGERASRYRAKYWDPEGEIYGIPTYWWKGAPDGLATRRQLRALSLSPGGHEPVAQVLWMRRRRDAVAYLYSIAAAKPKRVPDCRLSWRRWARRWPLGGPARAAGRTSATAIPTSLGECVDCHSSLRWQGGGGMKAALVSIETDEVGRWSTCARTRTR